MSKTPGEQVVLLNELEATLEKSGDPLECDIAVSEGNTGGKHVLVSLSPQSAA